MRYYEIAITNAQGQPVLPSSLGGLGITSLLPNGRTNLAALNIELDIPVAPFHAPSGQALVRVWGLGIQDIGVAADLNDMAITVKGGMSAGLPLANPAQAGLLVQGKIFQAYGNWVGTDQTVDLIIAPSTGNMDEPKNLVLNWKAGTPLATALASTLSTAFPGVKQSINISLKLVLNHDEIGYHYGLTQLSDLVNRLSKAIITTPGYPGVYITTNGATITAADGTIQPTPKAIAFQDMIGQPTWIGPQEIQVKLVMRGDLDLLDTVTLPPSLATATQQALLRFQDKSTFSGNFSITYLRHVGNFRQPDAASWNTTANMIPLPKAT